MARRDSTRAACDSFTSQYLMLVVGVVQRVSESTRVGAWERVSERASVGWVMP
jgi:hypothetical protein